MRLLRRPGPVPVPEAEVIVALAGRSRAGIRIWLSAGFSASGWMKPMPCSPANILSSFIVAAPSISAATSRLLKRVVVFAGS